MNINVPSEDVTRPGTHFTIYAIVTNEDMASHLRTWLDELVIPAAASHRCALEPAGEETAEFETGGPASTRQVFFL